MGAPMIGQGIIVPADVREEILEVDSFLLDVVFTERAEQNLVPSCNFFTILDNVDLPGGFLLGRTLAVLATMTLATSVAARQGPIAMAGHQICLQVWLAVSLLTDALAASAQGKGRTDG
ncbi:Protein detoxification 45, chloroplastic [Vitis vinifera]|uniref:Protein detoxification 45, chloroplastic n=1 Tax=Vitis vinifera TaxID=29760 RepID=A0A438IIW4_VITVI|nr:Protein detoxification 45, chloroplastic [Vitis vinifera]